MAHASAGGGGGGSGSGSSGSRKDAANAAAAERVAAQADEHFEARHYAAASAAYQKALGLCPYHASAADWYNSTGRAEQELDHLDAAVTWYTRAIARAPQESAYHNNRGMVYRKAGKPQHALEDYNTAIRLSATNAFPLYNRAMLLRDDPLKWGVALADLHRAKALFADAADQSDCDVEIAKITAAHSSDGPGGSGGGGGGEGGSGGAGRGPAVVASVSAVPSPHAAQGSGGTGGSGGVTVPLMATVASPGGAHQLALPPIPGPVSGLPQLYPPLPPPPSYPPPPTVPARPPVAPPLPALPVAGGGAGSVAPAVPQQYVPLNDRSAAALALAAAGQPIVTATLVAGPQNPAVAAARLAASNGVAGGSASAAAAALPPPLNTAQSSSSSSSSAAAADSKLGAVASLEGLTLPPTPAAAVVNGAGLLEGVAVGGKRKCPDPEDFSLGIGGDDPLMLQGFGALSDADLLTLDLMGGVATPGPGPAALLPPPLLRSQSLEQLQRSLNQEMPALPGTAPPTPAVGAGAGAAGAAVAASSVAVAAPPAPAPVAQPPQPPPAAAAREQPPAKRHKPDPNPLSSPPPAAALALPVAPLPPLLPPVPLQPPPAAAVAAAPTGGSGSGSGTGSGSDELERLRRELADMKQLMTSLAQQQQQQQHKPPPSQATDQKHTGLTPNAEPATPAGPLVVPPLTPAGGLVPNSIAAAQAALAAAVASAPPLPPAQPLAGALKVPPTPFNIASPAPPPPSAAAAGAAAVGVNKPMSPFTSAVPAPSPPAQSSALGVHPSPRTAAAAATASAPSAPSGLGKAQHPLARMAASPRTGAAPAPNGTTPSTSSSTATTTTTATATAPTLPVEQWSSTDVVQWLRAIGPVYAAYAPSFELNALNGIALLRLDVNLLRELGVKHVLHQHRLLSEFATLRAAAVSRNPALAALLPAHVALPLASAVVAAAAGSVAAGASAGAAAAANSSALTVTPGGPASAAGAGVTPGNPAAAATSLMSHHPPAPPPVGALSAAALGLGAGLGSRATGVSAAQAARVLAGLDVAPSAKDVLFPSGVGVLNPFVSTSSGGGSGVGSDDYWFRTVVDMRRQHDEDKQQWAIRFDEALERVHAQYRHRLLLLEHDKQYSDSKRIELEQKLKDIHDHRQCVVCMDGPRGVRFGCGHVCVCTSCADRLALDPKFQCPLCQRPVTERCTVYFG